MVEAILFDLYGVLALNGWQAFKAKHFSDRPEVWEAVFELGRKVDAGLLAYDELIKFTSQKTGESESTVRYQLEHTVPNDALLSFIQTELKPHYKIGILSNASNNAVHDILTEQQMNLFDSVVLSHHVGLIKPDTQMYEVAAEKLGLTPSSCLFIDDQERHTIGATEAGMQALVYTDLEALQTDLHTLLHT